MQTPEEMNDLAMKARKGDKEALLLLWQGCSRYACKVAMRYRNAAALNGAVDTDDLEQCAFLGFYEAVQDFDPLRGDFLTMLSYGVRKACRDALGLRGRERKEHYHTDSLDAPVLGTEDITMADTIPDEDAALPFEHAELRHDIEKALHCLPDSIESIIRLHDLQGLTMKQTAAVQDCTTITARNLRREGFAKLRKDKGLRVYCEAVRLRYKGYRAFQSDWTSVVEAEVIRRLDR